MTRPLHALHATIVLLGFATASPVRADAAMTLSALSDYDFRGISQSSGDSTLQLDAQYTGQAFYASAFASPVDFGPRVAGGTEVDLAAGVRHESASGLEWRAGVTRYVYPGAGAELGDPFDPSDDVAETADYAEFSVGAAGERFAVEYWYSRDLYGANESGSYVEASLALPLPRSFSLALHTGYSFGDYYESLEHEGGDDADYYDFAIGLERSLPQISLAITYVWTSTGREFQIDDGAFRNDGRVVLSLERSFALGGRRDRRR